MHFGDSKSDKTETKDRTEDSKSANKNDKNCHDKTKHDKRCRTVNKTHLF